MFSIDMQSRIPIYEQLYSNILSLTIKNVLKSGDQLPSVREMAKELGVNPNTITKAYSELEHDGIIYSLAGRGSFIGDIDISAIKEKAAASFDDAVKEALSKGFERKELCERIMKGEKQ